MAMVCAIPWPGNGATPSPRGRIVLADLRDRDRIAGEAHDGRGHDAIRETAAERSDKGLGMTHPKRIVTAACAACLVLAGCQRKRPAPTVRLLRITRDIEEGEKLASADLQAVAVPKGFESGFGNVVPEENLDFAVGMTLNRPIDKGCWLTWNHITGARKSRLRIPRGMVGFALPVDPRWTALDLLEEGQMVRVVGMFPAGPGLRAYSIIEGVRLLAVRRETERDEPRPLFPGAASMPSTCPSVIEVVSVPSPGVVTIAIDKDVALQLANVLSHASGDARIELLEHRYMGGTGAGRIDPKLRELAGSARTPVHSEEWK
jgi:hypothetical protein